jgi:hypothetical protein
MASKPMNTDFAKRKVWNIKYPAFCMLYTTAFSHSFKQKFSPWGEHWLNGRI